MKKNALEIKNLTKTFEKGHKPKLTLKEHFISPFSKRKTEKFNAVDGLSFEVKEGEFFGIIGRNGSGKSTLLKLLAGILEPTNGYVTINGKIVPFLELGVGFNPELTARENVFLNGAILGMSRKELSKKFDEIIKFAEVEEFVDTQVKNFSSGMYVRLAFAIAIQTEADIYLIDEILSVGDYAFQQKCFNLFRKLRKEGKTFIFVSHDLGAVQEFCDRAIYIKSGKLMFEGETEEVIKSYIRFDRQEEGRSLIGKDLGRNKTDGGSIKISILDIDDNPIDVVTHDQTFKIKLDYEITNEALKDDLVVGFGIYKNGEQEIFGTNSLIENKSIKFQKKGSVEFLIKNFPLMLGHFGVQGAIHNKNEVHYVWVDNGAEFDVVRTATRGGLVDMDVEILD